MNTNISNIFVKEHCVVKFMAKWWESSSRYRNLGILIPCDNKYNNWVMGLWYAFSKSTVMYCFQVQACVGIINLRHPFPRHIKAMRPSIFSNTSWPLELSDHWKKDINYKQTTEHMAVLSKRLDVLFDELVRLLY